MSLKEKFLGIKTYEEFDKKRHEFSNLDMSDEEIRAHASKVFGKSGLHKYRKDGAMVDFRKGEPPAK